MTKLYATERLLIRHTNGGELGKEIYDFYKRVLAGERKIGQCCRYVIIVDHVLCLYLFLCIGDQVLDRAHQASAFQSLIHNVSAIHRNS